jgi:SAM-dependent methyltransferase
MIPLEKTDMRRYSAYEAFVFQERRVDAWDDATARNLELIWKSISDTSARWLAIRARPVLNPSFPPERHLLWDVFARASEIGTGNLPFVAEISALPRGIALDLGCGNSGSASEVLERGWSVVAVDCSRAALECLHSRHREEVAKRQLRLEAADITEYVKVPHEPVDLVLGVDVFPYLNPGQFQETWLKIKDLVKPGGHFVGTIFYENPADLMGSNCSEDLGAWFLQDRRMVRPLLDAAGFDVVRCTFRVGSNQTIQFLAKRKV